MRKLLPILLALLGLGAGIGGGLALRPPPQPAAAAGPCGEAEAEPEAPEPDGAAHDYVKLNNQFVIPVVKQGAVDSLVILSLSLEVGAGSTERVYAVEPKLRDGFLQVLFDHANTGGFDGAFTGSGMMAALRKALVESARRTLGATVSDVLITDIVRQDG